MPVNRKNIIICVGVWAMQMDPHSFIDAGEGGVLEEAEKQKGHPVRGGLFTSSGAGERSRTPDLRITNALLYQLSYTGKNQNLFKPCLYYLVIRPLAARKPCRA